MARKCSWCSRDISDEDKYWCIPVREYGIIYNSKEVFCSPKCSHEYPHKATPNKEQQGDTDELFQLIGSFIVIAILIILYLIFR
jgi:predicted nucleic acid-binding Zn ribbon protein